MIPAWQLLRCHMFVYLKWEATSPVFLHDINHKYKWQDWIECLNTDASTNKSIIVKIKCQPLFILFRNVSSTQRSFPYWRDTMLWWRHKKPSSQFLWLSDQWTFLWINDDLDLIRLHLSQEANSINHSATDSSSQNRNNPRKTLLYPIKQIAWENLFGLVVIRLSKLYDRFLLFALLWNW